MAMHKQVLVSSTLLLSLVLVSILGQAALAITPGDLQAKAPDNNAVDQMAKVNVGQSYLDSLRSPVLNFRDYQVYCQLFSKKSGTWKDFGGAFLYFKQRALLRAEIKSSDYRNGSVVVRQPDGRIRGKGGGGLSLVKMTIRPDSRSIRLPTGFSLAESDFVSLYDTLKNGLSKGDEMAISKAPIAMPFFKDPVTVLVIRGKPEEGSARQIQHVLYLNPKTKLPLGWNTYKDGESNAFVFFEKMDPDKGLTDDLFKL